jgi:hypothetical protein
MDIGNALCIAVIVRRGGGFPPAMRTMIHHAIHGINAIIVGGTTPPLHHGAPLSLLDINAYRCASWDIVGLSCAPLIIMG